MDSIDEIGVDQITQGESMGKRRQAEENPADVQEELSSGQDLENFRRIYLKNAKEGHLGGQSVKCLTLGFGSCHDLTVRGFEPHTVSAEPAWDSFLPSLSALPSPPNK